MWHPGLCLLLWGPTVQTQRPLSHFSLLFSLILLWSLSCMACPLLSMACWPAPQPWPPPSRHSSAIQFHHTESHHWLVLQETAASNWACFSSWLQWVFSTPWCNQAFKHQSTVLQFVLLSSMKKTEVVCEVAVRHGFYRANWLCKTHVICFWKSHTT